MGDYYNYKFIDGEYKLMGGGKVIITDDGSVIPKDNPKPNEQEMKRQGNKWHADPAYAYMIDICKRIFRENPNAVFSSDGIKKAIRLHVLNDLSVVGMDGKKEIKYELVQEKHKTVLRKYIEILQWMFKKNLIGRHDEIDNSGLFYWSAPGVLIPETEYVKIVKGSAALETQVDGALARNYPGHLGALNRIRKGYKGEGPEPDQDDEEDEDEDEEIERSKLLVKDDKDEDEDEELPESETWRRLTKANEEVEKLRRRVQVLEATVEPMEKQIRDLERTRITELHIITPNKKKQIVKGTVHKIFPEVMFHIECGDPVMLVGPKGCGKTELAKMMAKQLKLKFGFQSLSGGVTESKFFGRSVQNITTGKTYFSSTEFLELYENGGLFLLDEVDGGDNNVLLAFNGPLANKQCALDRHKDPIVDMHEDFVCMAAANTWGAGADRQYVGRNQLDGAFVERFIQLEIDYDEDLEYKICEGNSELVELLHHVRQKMRDNRIERVLSTRFIARAHNWMRHGKEHDFVLSRLFMGWREDERAKVR